MTSTDALTTPTTLADVPLDTHVRVQFRGEEHAGGNAEFVKYCDGKFEDDAGTRVLVTEGANRFHLNVRIVKDGWVEKVEQVERVGAGEDGASKGTFLMFVRGGLWGGSKSTTTWVSGSAAAASQSPRVFSLGKGEYEERRD